MRAILPLECSHPSVYILFPMELTLRRRKALQPFFTTPFPMESASFPTARPCPSASSQVSRRSSFRYAVARHWREKSFFSHLFHSSRRTMAGSHTRRTRPKIRLPTFLATSLSPTRLPTRLRSFLSSPVFRTSTGCPRSIRSRKHLTLFSLCFSTLPRPMETPGRSSLGT